MATPSEHYHQQYVTPFVGITGCTVGTTRFAMHTEMAADHQFVGICHHMWLIDPHYDEEERGEFIAYWFRPERLPHNISG